MQFIKGEAAYAPPSLSLTKPFLRETIFGQKLSNSLSFQGHTLTTSKSIKNFKTENFPHAFKLNDLIRGPRERGKKKNGCVRIFLLLCISCFVSIVVDPRVTANSSCTKIAPLCVHGQLPFYGKNLGDLTCISSVTASS